MLSTHPVFEHRARALVALLALAIAAFALAACGGSSGGDSGGGGGTGDAQTLLTQTFTGSHKIDSGKANLQLTVDAQGDPSLRGPIKLAVTGPFQTVGKGQLPKFDLALDVNAQGQGIKAGVTSTSDQLFVNFGGSSYVVPASLMARLKQSYQQSQGKPSSKQSLGALGIHPLDWLKDPTIAGTDTVGGVTTEHITAQIDVGKLLDDLDTILGKVKSQLPSAAAAGAQVPDHLSAATRTQIEQAVKQATVDVWTGKDDHTLRKISLALSVQPKSSGSGPKSATVNLSFEIDDLNQPQTITAPTATKPLSDLLGQLQGLLGGALGGAGLGGASGGVTPGAGASAKVDKYAKCLQQANGDATKMQSCQSLLTK